MSTEQTAVFSRKQEIHPKQAYTPKGALNLSEIQHQNGHGNAADNRVLQLRHNETQSTLALGYLQNLKNKFLCCEREC